MSVGSGAEKRAQAVARHAARLRAEGLTMRQIADATGIKPELVTARVKLGERLLSIKDAKPGDKHE
jgi:hypothetical protein